METSTQCLRGDIANYQRSTVRLIYDAAATASQSRRPG